MFGIDFHMNHLIKITIMNIRIKDQESQHGRPCFEYIFIKTIKITIIIILESQPGQPCFEYIFILMKTIRSK